MNLIEFKQLVHQIKIGKQLPDAVYIHKELMLLLPNELLAYLGKIHSKITKTKEFNLLKIFKKEFRVSFLFYPDFETDPHPCLAHSLTIDLENNNEKLLNYTKSNNPPILHRKETFINEEHPQFSIFKTLTEAEENFGLYKNLNKIGFKKYWDNLILKNDLIYHGHQINKSNSESENKHLEQIIESGVIEVERHKTAISRNNLSRPLQTILGYDLLTKDTTYFDYGCGLGDDIKELSAHGYQAHGWDPAHNPNSEKKNAEIINLGFVLNVIENQEERSYVLRDAFKLAEKLLVVSVLTKNGVDENKGKIYKDGILTSRNTFQKYYEQEEIKAFIETTLSESAIPVSMGIFYIYKTEEDYLSHLNRQYRSHIDWQLLVLNNKAKDKPITVRKDKWEKHQELLTDFWYFTVSLGRCPKNG